MDDPSNPPVQPAIPTPDIPTPDIPTPDFPPPSPSAAGEAHAPGQLTDPPPAMAGVPVKTFTAKGVEESELQEGSLAPFNPRIIAALIDLAVAVGLQLTLSWLLPHFAGRLAMLAGIAYLVTRDSLPFLGGQSFGKKAMNLKAVTLDGRSLVGLWEPAILRNVAFLIPPIALVEVVILLTREGKPEHGRRLGDEWAKTQVIVAHAPPAAG